MATDKLKKLVLENGQEFPGQGFGSGQNIVGELIFNTSMVGYQEILSDTCYLGQIVVMTYPTIGHYGINAEDNESKGSFLGAMVTREICDAPSNFRYTKTIDEELEERGIPGISGLDTRMLTRIIRDNGPMKAAIVDAQTSREEALKLIAEFKPVENPVERVSCTKRWFSRTPNHKYNVVVLDCGLKNGIVRELNNRGCNVTVVPFNSSVEDIKSYEPDSIVISSGPGDPRELKAQVEVIKSFLGKLPVFGISLGQELIAMAYGAQITELEGQHHGGQMVKDLATGKIYATEQNHRYAVDAASMEGTGLEVTYRNIVDGSVEGIECVKDKAFAVQFYPEGAPGPKDCIYLFDKLIKLMED